MNLMKRVIIAITLLISILIPILSACGTNAPASTTQKILSAPVGVMITASGGQNTLKWIPVQGATSYNVYSSTTSKFDIKNASVSNTVSTSFIPSQGNYYKVTAKNDNDESVSSAEVCDTSLALPVVATGYKKMYVVNSGDNTVSVIDLNNYSITKTILVGLTPNYIAVDINTKKAYVTNYADSTISIIDIATDTVVGTITGVTTPAMIKLDPVTNILYAVSNTNPNLTVIDANTNKVISSIICGSWTRGVALDTNANKAYITNTVSDSISVVDILTNTVIATIPLGLNAQPHGIDIDIAAKKVYAVNHNTATVSIIDTTTNTVVSTIPCGNYPQGVVVNSAQKRIYVTNTWVLGLGIPSVSDTLTVIDLVTNNIIATIPVGVGPLVVEYNSVTNLIYVSNTGTNNVFVIDANTNQVIAKFPVGKGSVGLAVIP